MSRAVLNGSIATAALLAFALPLLADESDDEAVDGRADTRDGGTAELAGIDRTPETCISTPRIRSTEIIDDQTILFYMRGGKVYRNVLDKTCHGLESNDLFTYRIRSTRLCRMDRVTVLMRFGTGFMEGMSCSLGGFHPMTPEEAELMELEPDEVQSLQNSVRMTPVAPRDQSPVGDDTGTAEAGNESADAAEAVGAEAAAAGDGPEDP